MNSHIKDNFIYRPAGMHNRHKQKEDCHEFFVFLYFFLFFSTELCIDSLISQKSSLYTIMYIRQLFVVLFNRSCVLILVNISIKLVCKLIVDQRFSYLCLYILGWFTIVTIVFLIRQQFLFRVENNHLVALKKDSYEM